MPYSNNQYAPPFVSKTRLIEIGGGKYPIIHPNVDILPGPSVDVVHDLSVFPWPLKDNSYDGVFCQYCIEHVEWRKTMDFIRELYRILSPNGSAVIITANLLEQCKSVVDEGVNLGTNERIFGSQEFPNYGGCHKSGFSPEYAKELFMKAGFNQVNVLPHPVSKTDMIIEAFKMKEVFEREYFEDGTIGYREYRDFCTHYSMARFIMKQKPESVLDVGCGRGYVVRVLENEGIKAVGMDVSNHCWHTRATDSFILHDVTNTPWPSVTPSVSNLTGNILDKQFDLCFSSNLLEHIPEDKIDTVIQEMVRVSKRGLHAIHYTDPPYQEVYPDIDVSHVTMHPKQWWVDKFKSLAPDYPVQIEYPRTMEYEDPYQQPPTSMAPGVWADKDGKLGYIDQLNKLNLGSWKNMFYYGWVNIDIADLSQFAKEQAYRFRQIDVTKGIPCGDNEVDIIFHSHLLEHFSRIEGFQFLKECHRVMKPGGIIRVSVPDAEKLAMKYLDGSIKEYRYVNVGVENAHDDAEALHELLYANHKTLYDMRALTQVLSEAGFSSIRPATPFKSRSATIETQTMNTFPTLSLVIEAEKQ